MLPPDKRVKIIKIVLDNRENCGRILLADAGVAHPVERHLAKVEVASSSLVARSIIKDTHVRVLFLFSCSCFHNGYFVVK